MSYIERVSFPAVLVLTALVGIYGCGKPAAPPPGAPDKTSDVSVDQGTELEAAPAPPAAEGAPAEGEAKESKTADKSSAGEWGTLTGRIVYEGTPPKPEPIDRSKDANCKEKLTTENLVVGDKGGLANAVIMLRTKNVPVNPEYEKTADADVTLDNKNCRFEPHIQMVRLSQKLLIKNSDPTGHNTNLAPLQMQNPAINPILAANSDPVAYHFSAEEALPVKVGCNIHPWMGAWVIARKDPYAAVTDKDGKFTIKDLPAGKELEFRLWQESSGYLKNATFKGGKSDTRGTFKYKLKPGENDLGDIKVSGSIFKK
jgi:hypothetical protein